MIKKSFNQSLSACMHWKYWWPSGYAFLLVAVKLRVRFPLMPLDFWGGIFNKFIHLHCWRALSSNWVPGAKPREGDLGTGPGLAPVPFAGPKEQSAPGPSNKEPEMGATLIRWVKHTIKNWNKAVKINEFS